MGRRGPVSGDLLDYSAVRSGAGFYAVQFLLVGMSKQPSQYSVPSTKSKKWRKRSGSALLSGGKCKGKCVGTRAYHGESGCRSVATAWG